MTLNNSTDKTRGAVGLVPDRVRAAGRLEPACRLLLCAIFLSTGIAGLASPSGFAAGLGQMGVPLPGIAGAATTAINLVGPALLIANPRNLGWIAAFALAAFTLVTVPFGHPFWRLAEPHRSEEFRIAAEHVSLTGGLLLAGLTLRRRALRP